MRDDIYALTKAERRAAVADWRATNAAARREAVRLAKVGRPAPDPAVSDAARRYAECVLQRSWWNRLPRSAMACSWLVLTVAFALLAAVDPRPADFVFLVVALVATGYGVLTWDLRREARVVVQANVLVWDC